MKLKLVILAAVILVVAFTLISILRPSNSLENLQKTMEDRHHIIINDIPMEQEKITVPTDFNEVWQLMEDAARKSNYSFEGYKGKTLTKYRYFVLDSPFQRSHFVSDTNLHLLVFADGDKVVAAYLAQEQENSVPLPLGHQ